MYRPVPIVPTPLTLVIATTLGLLTVKKTFNSFNLFCKLSALYPLQVQSDSCLIRQNSHSCLYGALCMLCIVLIDCGRECDGGQCVYCPAEHFHVCWWRHRISHG